MKVLVVEDEQMGRDTLRMLLSTSGYDVRTAADGPQALDIATTFHPDAVVTDLVLGEPMDGFGLARALRKMQPAVQIVIMSGGLDFQQMAPQDMRTDFLKKPFRLTELLDLLGDVRPS